MPVIEAIVICSKCGKQADRTTIIRRPIRAENGITVERHITTYKCTNPLCGKETVVSFDEEHREICRI